jgi:serine/threonine-protein kinase
VISGPHTGRVFSFDGHDVFIVGRSKRAHFQLRKDDMYFSRIHFLVEVNPPHCHVLDMNSQNGTYVNQEKIVKADLQDGDEIRAGKTILRVSTGTSPAPQKDKNEPVRTRPLVRPNQIAPTTALPAAAPTSPSAAGVKSTLIPGDVKPSRRRGPRYQIIRKIGQGSVGTIYLASRTADGLLVALKQIRSNMAGNERELKRFLREAEILKRLSHPNIVACLDTGHTKGYPYFVMEYVPGTDAGQIVKTQGSVDIARGVRLICDVLEGLEYAHAQGYVHRDVTPSNILLIQDGRSERVKLADFGLARVYIQSNLSGVTLLGKFSGTVPFMAPEQITDFRSVLPSADQYSAAASLYYLLTGRHLYNRTENLQEQVLNVLQRSPVPIRSRRADIPVELAEVIHRALARDPEKRFPDAGKLRAALAPFRK